MTLCRARTSYTPWATRSVRMLGSIQTRPIKHTALLHCIAQHLVHWIARGRALTCGLLERQHQRNEKISNSSSFGIIDIAESSTTDRIIVIIDTACFIHDGAYR